MKKIGILLVASAFALSACGKRSDDTGSTAAQGPTGYNAQGEPIGGAVTPGLGAAIGQELTVRVISSEPSLLTGGQFTADITASVSDSNNLPVADVLVAFSSSGGRLLGVTDETVTDENGEAAAVLSLTTDSANQDIFVKVIAETFEGMARVVAQGSTLELNGDDNVVLGNDVTIEAKLTAGDGDPIDNEIVTITSSNGNTLSTSSELTDPQGIVTVTVSSTNGGDTVTFSALNNSDGTPTVNESHAFTVSDDQLQFVADSATELSVNQSHDFTVEWSFNGAPIANEDLKFTITAGQVVGASTVTTDSAGKATVSVLSSIAGEVTLFVEAPDGSVNNKHTFEFVGDTPATISVTSTSSRVNIRDKATIVSKVTDANGNPVKDTMVIFSSSNLKGGQLSTTSAQTNVKGEAEITFTAGSTATEQDEIEVFAEVSGSNINSGVQLTVVEPVLNVTIGSSNLVELVGANTQYAVTYVVQVADGGGQALQNAQVQLSIEPLLYGKGQRILVNEIGQAPDEIVAPAVWTSHHWAAHSTSAFFCFSEDTNGNRILDAGEDTNGNGSLDPQDPALLGPVADEGLATLEGNGILTTDSTGSGYFRVVYPVTNAGWASVNVVARAQALGVEATDELFMDLGFTAKQYLASNTNPINRVSPYGFDLDCTTSY